MEGRLNIADGTLLEEVAGVEEHAGEEEDWAKWLAGACGGSEENGQRAYQCRRIYPLRCAHL